VVPNIPPKANRRWKNCFSPWLYRHRNAIERMFGRLKDFRRIATRYDRLARNFLASVCLAATLCYSLWVWTLSVFFMAGVPRTRTRDPLIKAPRRLVS
jgi:hypothetical protein